MPPAGPRAPGWARPVPRSSRRSGLGQGKVPPVPAGQGKAEHTARRRSRSFVQWGAPPGPAARGAHPCGWPTVTGWTRRRYGAAAPGGNAPEMHLQTDRMGAVARRWGRTGYAATCRLGPGAAWCWLTPAGMTAAVLGCPAARPSLARLDHPGRARPGLPVIVAGAPG